MIGKLNLIECRAPIFKMSAPSNADEVCQKRDDGNDKQLKVNLKVLGSPKRETFV